MDLQQYCRDRVLVPGAGMYFSQHFLDPESVSKLVVLQAFFIEIASIPERVSDVGVALSKLGWWIEEIGRSWQGEGRHPISQAAEQEGISRLVSANDMVGLVNEVAGCIDQEPHASLDELLAFCSAIGGMAARLEAQVCAAGQDSLEAANQFGTAHYMATLTRDIGMDARAGRWFIPMDLQARHQFSRDQAAAGNASDSFRGLVTTMANTAGDVIDQALESLSRPQQRQLRHLVIQAALDQKLIGKMRANPNKILQQRMQLSPFASLWTVWRAARQPGVD